MVTQTFVNRYLNKEAYLFNGINLENQGAIGIGGSDTISFQAGTEVRLKPGFEVTWGGRFAAVIGDEPNCYYGPNLPLTEDETEENTVLEDATRYQGPLTMHLYPNPADEKAEVLLNFKLPDAQDCTISILDLSGKMLHSTKVNGIAGNNLFMLPAELMNAGMYFVHLQTETDQITKKLVIQSSN